MGDNEIDDNHLSHHTNKNYASMNNKKLKVETQRHEGGDYIYYNMNIVNNSDRSERCEFATSLQQSIVENAKSDYVVSCIRFSLDGSNIPIFVFVNNAYYLTLSWNGFTITQPVAYIADDIEFGVQTVYSYQSMVNMINTTFSNIFNALDTLSTGSLSTALTTAQAGSNKPPVMIYDIASGTFPIYFPESYITNATAPVNCYMNSRLFGFFYNYRFIKYCIKRALKSEPNK